MKEKATGLINDVWNYMEEQVVTSIGPHTCVQLWNESIASKMISVSSAQLHVVV